jgi:hypothetical protein
MVDKLIVAIDPGKSGGIVYGQDEWCEGVKMPETLGDLVELFNGLHQEHSEIVAYLEKVGGFAGTGQPGSAMFKFGQGYGQIQGVIAAMGWPLNLVTPQRWIKSQHLGVKGDMTTTEWKNKLKGQAQMLYPQHKITLKTADAFLIFHSATNGNL